MISKRKIIKKRHRRNNNTQDLPATLMENQSSKTILERLNCIDKNLQLQAITILSNLQQIPDSVLNHEVLQGLINKLYNSDNSVIYSTLFALQNICGLNPKMVPNIFEIGLDKALMQLKSTNTELFKPIVIFMTTVSPYIPKKYAFLVQGVQKTLATVQNLKIEFKQLTLNFLIESKASLKQFDPIFIQQLWNIFKNNKSYETRGLALKLIVNSRNQFSSQQSLNDLSKLKHFFVEFLQETISEIDLTHQYEVNVAIRYKKLKQFQQKESMIQQEEMIPKTVQDSNQYKKDNIEMEKNEQTLQAAYNMFMKSVEAVQFTLQMMLELQQEWDQDSDSDEEEVQQDAQMNEQIAKNVTNQSVDFTAAVNQFVLQNIKKMHSNATLNFSESFYIVQYTLRIINNLTNFSSIAEQITIIAEDSIAVLIKLNPSHEIFTEILNLCFQLLLKTKKLRQRQILLALLDCMKINMQWKNSWVNLLELFSLHFNPEKNKVTPQENVKIGTALKMLLQTIPSKQLEQWRCQTIDTLFDVYSNEDHDKNFVELGFMESLVYIQSMGNQIVSSKAKGKKIKFIKEVLADIRRFIQYKRKMIKL